MLTLLVSVILKCWSERQIFTGSDFRNKKTRIQGCEDPYLQSKSSYYIVRLPLSKFTFSTFDLYFFTFSFIYSLITSRYYVAEGWMVTASQYPAKVYIALQLLRKEQRTMNCQIQTLSLSNTLLCNDDSAFTKEGVKSKMKIYVPALNYIAAA